MGSELQQTQRVLHEVAMERTVQRKKWRNQHDDLHSSCFWAVLLGAYTGRVVNQVLCMATPSSSQPLTTPRSLRRLLVKVAAVAVAWVETLDRRGEGGPVSEHVAKGGPKAVAGEATAAVTGGDP